MPKRYTWIEEYAQCGCSAEFSKKSMVLGYCATHGTDTVRLIRITLKSIADLKPKPKLKRNVQNTKSQVEERRKLQELQAKTRATFGGLTLTPEDAYARTGPAKVTYESHNRKNYMLLLTPLRTRGIQHSHKPTLEYYDGDYEG